MKILLSLCAALFATVWLDRIVDATPQRVVHEWRESDEPACIHACCVCGARHAPDHAQERDEPVSKTR